MTNISSSRQFLIQNNHVFTKFCLCLSDRMLPLDYRTENNSCYTFEKNFQTRAKILLPCLWTPLTFQFLSYTEQKKVRDHNFQYNFSGILNLTVNFNISAYVAIIWLSFDKNLTVLSKSQTELRSVKYDNATKWSVQKYGRRPPLNFRQFLSMSVIFYGYIVGTMLWLSIIMTTAGIKWCNDGILEIFEFCLKNMFLT